MDARVAVLFVAGGLVGAFVGARLAMFLPDSAQMLLFALTLLAAAAAMHRRATEPGETVATAPATPVSRPAWLVPMLGAGVGMLTGIMGVGGGFLIVPALTLLAGMPVKRAAATSLWIIAANSATGMLGYLGRVPIAWGTAGLFLAVALVGMIAGLQVARTATPRRLQAAFALFLVLVGLFTIAKSLRFQQAAPAASGQAARLSDIAPVRSPELAPPPVPSAPTLPASASTASRAHSSGSRSGSP